MKYIKIPLQEYVDLLNRDLLLSAMEADGVDNWQGGYNMKEVVEYKIEDFVDRPEITEE